MERNEVLREYLGIKKRLSDLEDEKQRLLEYMKTLNDGLGLAVETTDIEVVISARKAESVDVEPIATP